MRACMEMEAVCKDDAAEPASKLDAVEKWFRDIGWMAPKELEASMAKAFGLRPIT